MIYKFYDTDFWGQEERDISGYDYTEFLNMCFTYCTTVSFCLAPKNREGLSKLEKDRLTVTPYIKEQYRHYGNFSTGDTDKNTEYTIVHYRLSADVQKWLLTTVDSLFEWTSAWGNTNPDDPVFYRADGSVFFTSTIHEGNCTLMPKNNENIDCIIQKGYWEQIK